MALAIHELVTNSTKYGALSGTGHLSVGWRRDAGDVELRWVESGLAATPDLPTETFGTQFLPTQVEPQPKASSQLPPTQNTLSILIPWPDTAGTACTPPPTPSATLSLRG